MTSDPSHPVRPKKRGCFGCLVRLALTLAVGVAIGVAVTWSFFPGQRLGMAVTIGTGVGTEDLQAKVDALEDKAIRRQPFTSEDKEFLVDLYRTLATGAEMTILVAQTGRLMDHYLDGSGEDFKLEPAIFTDNIRVQGQIKRLRSRANLTRCTPSGALVSPTFYMPHRSSIDSVFGLYYGTVELTLVRRGEQCVQRWRAEVPWYWPSYPSLERKYDHSHAESFPLPNITSLVAGQRYALTIDNGLGEYLVQLGLAAPFTAYSEWEE